MPKLNRRNFIKASGAGAVVASTGIGMGVSSTAHAKAAMVNTGGAALLPKAKGP